MQQKKKKTQRFHHYLTIKHVCTFGPAEPWPYWIGFGLCLQGHGLDDFLFIGQISNWLGRGLATGEVGLTYLIG